MAAHTSLGTMPIHLWGTDEQKDDWLPQLCCGAEARRLRADRARGRLGRRQHQDPRQARGRRVGRQRRQAVHHQLRHRDLRLRDDHRGHRRGRTAPGRSPTSSSPTAPPATSPASPTGRWAGTPPTRGRSPSTTAGCRRATCSAAAATASSSSCRSSTAAGSGWRRWASASPRGRSTRRSPTRRSVAPSASRSRKFQAIQAKIADLSAQIEAARLLVYRAAQPQGARRALHAHRRPGEADHRPARRARRPRRPSRSTAATATSRSTRSAASTATPRSSPSARAPTRSSRW